MAFTDGTARRRRRSGAPLVGNPEMSGAAAAELEIIPR